MSYTQARRSYLEWYSHLLQAPDPHDLDDREETAFDLLANRVDGFNAASEELTIATKPYLQEGDHLQRTAALNNLLQQIEGDLEVANTLWGSIEEEESDIDEAPTAIITRSIQDNRLRDTFRRLATNLEDLSQPIVTETRRSASLERRPATREEALEDLQLEIDQTISLIHDRVITVSLRLLRDTLSMGSAEWTIIMKGVDLLKGRDQVGNVGWGLEDEVKAAASEVAGALRGVLANIVEKVLLVIEKNDLVRYTIADWLEDLRDTVPGRRKERLTSLLEQLYQTQSFRQFDLPIWLRDSSEVEKIHQAAEQIVRLGDQFELLANQVRRLGGVLGVGSLFLSPTLKSVGFALQVGLLGTLVFAGYDYLDEGTRALNITKGIKEVLIETLSVSPQTREEAENMRLKTVRATR